MRQLIQLPNGFWVDKKYLEDPPTCEHAEIGNDLCEECCDHDDVCPDERCCLICGKDMTEDMMASAYDYCKDRMKYGD